MPSITVNAEISDFEKITDFLESNVISSQKVLSELCVISDEIFSNTVNYSQATEVTVNIKNTEFEGLKAVSIDYIDNGKAFNPILSKDPDTTLSAEERGIGGLGIFLVKQLSDSLSYSRTETSNILTVVKKI